MQIFRDFFLSEIVYYKIGGKARFVLKIENKEDLLESLDFIRKNKIKRVMPIGLGSNLLVNDKLFDGTVLWFSSTSKNSIIQKDGSLIEVFASSILDDLIQFAFNKNLIGLEWAGGLPSTIGGAIRGNVGAFGGEIKNSVYKVEAIELLDSGNYQEREFATDELKFSYRDSLIKQKNNLIVTSCLFKLEKADKDKLSVAKATYLSHIDYRNKNHPMDYPSCGSVFKNITKKEEVKKTIDKWPDIKELVDNKWYHKASMGYVINRLGFSGFRIGGAEVSKKHANYIVNVYNAKFNDVCSIIEKIKEKFSQTFGFPPELEVEVVE